MKIEIIKQRVNAPSRKLNIKWTVEDFEFFEPERKKPETEEEEAEEIIHRLKAPPVRRRNNAYHGIDLEKEITEALSKSIIAEIDNEIMSSYGQGKSRTR